MPPSLGEDAEAQALLVGAEDAWLVDLTGSRADRAGTGTPELDASAACRIVVAVGARIVPFDSDTVASARHAFAAARVGKERRIFLPSRRL